MLKPCREIFAKQKKGVPSPENAGAIAVWTIHHDITAMSTLPPSGQERATCPHIRNAGATCNSASCYPQMGTPLPRLELGSHFRLALDGQKRGTAG